MNDHFFLFFFWTRLFFECLVLVFLFFFFPFVFQGHFFFFITSFWLSLHQEVSAFNNLCMRDEQRCINSRDVDLIVQVDNHTILIAWLIPPLIFFISNSSEN